MGTPVKLLLSSQKCQGVFVSTICQIHYFCSGPISVDSICPQPSVVAVTMTGNFMLGSSFLVLALNIKVAKKIPDVADNQQFDSIYIYIYIYKCLYYVYYMCVYIYIYIYTHTCIYVDQAPSPPAPRPQAGAAPGLLRALAPFYHSWFLQFLRQFCSPSNILSNSCSFWPPSIILGFYSCSFFPF